MATVSALVIEPSGRGRVVDVVPTVEAIKALIGGGFLAGVYCPEGAPTTGWHAYVDEDGQSRQLPLNREGWAFLSALAGMQLTPVLLGPIVFLGDNHPDEADVPDEVLDFASMVLPMGVTGR